MSITKDQRSHQRKPCMFSPHRLEEYNNIDMKSSLSWNRDHHIASHVKDICNPRARYYYWISNKQSMWNHWSSKMKLHGINIKISFVFVSLHQLCSTILPNCTLDHHRIAAVFHYWMQSLHTKIFITEFPDQHMITVSKYSKSWLPKCPRLLHHLTGQIFYAWCCLVEGSTFFYAALP